MTSNAILWIIVVAIGAVLAFLFLKRPALRRHIPFYNHFRFAAMYLAGRKPPLPLGELYRGMFHQGNQDRVRDRIQSRSRLLETDPQGFALWEVPAGKFWIPPGADPEFLFGVFAEMDRHVYGTGEFGVHPGDVVVDCGANVGAFIHQALAAGARTVIAVEISPDTAECLRRSFAPEIRSGKVIVYPKGMWHQEEMLRLHIHPRNSGENGVVMDLKSGTLGPTVPLTTLDNMANELRLDAVNFIKMDIEGAEQNALRGARETIARFHPRLAITCYHLREDVTKIPEVARAAWPDYRLSCGPCGIVDRMIRPEILYFS